MQPLQSLPGVGPKTLEKLNRLSINSAKDLVYHLPFRYLDFSQIKKISTIRPNENVTVTGRITSFQNIYTNKGKNLQKAVLNDHSGSLDIIWFNQPYLSKSIKVGGTYTFAGNITLFRQRPTLVSPYRGEHNSGKIIGIYPETKGLTSQWFRKSISVLLPKLSQEFSDPLPAFIRTDYHLLDLPTALMQMHQPSDPQTLTQARIRLALDEVLALQSQSQILKAKWLEKSPRQVLKTNPLIEKKLSRFLDSLPFRLTKSQQIAWEEIKSDLLSGSRPANRLLQGDVGSGKTIVAALACLLASQNRTLSVLIAPTEILAQQHFQNFSKYFKGFRTPLVLLTSATRSNFSDLKPNSIVIATHAAIYQKTRLSNASIVIFDEQHKFGVKQRSFLADLPNPPHLITMTATPIPRTVSLTMLGNLDLSLISTIPQNRPPIKTFYVAPVKQSDCYQWVKRLIQTTSCQAFVVCPFISESVSLSEVSSAETEFLTLSKNVFPELKVGLVHGKTPSQEREKIIELFRHNQINILVTTPIIEVGVDIPNATIMVIQTAERFGLAQLHQLRGRVGRGLQQSYCYLFSQSTDPSSIKRLLFLEKCRDGLKIARQDLLTRGPGEIFSFLQHGFPSLKLAHISDLKLIKLGQEILQSILKADPGFDLNLFTQNLTLDDSIVSN
jgi:ATP-dependent DNA helicase RecG